MRAFMISALLLNSQGTRYRQVVLYGPQGTEVPCDVLRKIRDDKNKTKRSRLAQMNGFDH